MADLIDRDALLESIDKKFFATCPIGDEQLGYLNSRNLVRTAPAVDAVEVVRCKDCMWRGREDDCPLLSLTFYTDPDQYCSYGERKADERYPNNKLRCAGGNGAADFDGGSLT